MTRAWLGILLGVAGLLGMALSRAEAGSEPPIGLRAMEQKQCISCHTIPGTDPHYRTAPSLDRVNQKVKADWLTSYLHSPEALETSLNMPRIHLDPQEIQDLAAFVIGEPPPSKPVTLGDRARGQKLFEDLDCLACHYGGEFSPDLTNLGHKVRPDWLSTYLAKPQDYHAGIVMPSFRLTAGETQDLTAYLVGRAILPNDVPFQGGSAAKGRALAEAKTCTSCHSLPGLRTPDKRPVTTVSPELRKGLEGVIAGQEDLNTVIHPQLAKTMSYGWELEEDARIAQALLVLPSQPMVGLATEDRVLAEGRRIVNKYNCRGCHVIEGRGESFAPHLDIEGLRVREGWLKHFLAGPEELRPDHPGRMPSFPLKPGEIESLLEYFQAIASDGKYPNPTPIAQVVSREHLERGRTLFTQQNCGWCHLVDGKAPPVAVALPAGADLSAARRFAPDLAHAPDRLKEGWTEHWIKHPRDYLPNTLMPGYPLTPEDVAALRAYLLAEKH
ncbi:Nitric oxide reductase subunit C [compost metagenome]